MTQTPCPCRRGSVGSIRFDILDGGFLCVRCGRRVPPAEFRDIVADVKDRLDAMVRMADRRARRVPS